MNIIFYACFIMFQGQGKLDFIPGQGDLNQVSEFLNPCSKSVKS